MNFALPLPPEQAHQLAARTIFSAKEIQGLYRRFKELDVSAWHLAETVVPLSLQRRMASATPERPSETHMRALRAASCSSPRRSELGVADSCSGASSSASAPTASARRVLWGEG